MVSEHLPLEQKCHDRHYSVLFLLGVVKSLPVIGEILGHVLCTKILNVIVFWRFKKIILMVINFF